VAIGHEPATELVEGKLKMKSFGYVWIAPNSTATSVPGLLAACDIASDISQQTVTAAELGCMAAPEARRFLAAEENQRAAAE
jgi:thioredoxin reductase (NADPH)